MANWLSANNKYLQLCLTHYTIFKSIIYFQMFSPTIRTENVKNSKIVICICFLLVTTQLCNVFMNTAIVFQVFFLSWCVLLIIIHSSKFKKVQFLTIKYFSVSFFHISVWLKKKIFLCCIFSINSKNYMDYMTVLQMTVTRL